MKARVLVVMVSAAVPALAAGAAAAAQNQGGIAACSAITDPAARLACFDAESARLDSNSGAKVEAPAAPVRPAPEAPASRSTPAPPTAATSTPAVPTLGEEQLRRNDSSPQNQETLKAKISETRRGSGGVYFVTLDNGQVWRHEEGSMAEFLRPGSAVTISRASMGSYRLTLDAGSARNWVRVTRVR